MYLMKKAGYKRDEETDDTPDARMYLMKKAAAPYKRFEETYGNTDNEVVGRGLFDPLKRAAPSAGCDCETAYQQCREQNGCNIYYRSLSEIMIKLTWAGGSNPGAGSSNPCATCVSISIMTIFDQNQEVYKIYRSIYVMNSSADIIEILLYTLHHCSITSSKLSVIHIF